MKVIFTLILFILVPSLYAQEKLIVELLNKELNAEAEYRKRHPAFPGDTLIVIAPYTITENKILSVTVKKAINNGHELEIIKQEVPLKKIQALLKDVNVIFLSAGDDVTTTTTRIASNKTTLTQQHTSDLFFLHLSSQQQSEEWQHDIIKAFSMAGLSLNKEIWAD